MRKKFFMVFLFIMFILPFHSVFSEDNEMVTDIDQSYICGDSFEIRFPFDPTIVNYTYWRDYSIDPYPYTISTKPPDVDVSVIYDISLGQPDNGESMVQIRVVMRNLTANVLNGLSKNSFILRGYMPDGSVLEYKPIAMPAYDREHKGYYDKYHLNLYEELEIRPLDIIDTLLVYIIPEELTDFEVAVNPVSDKTSPDLVWKSKTADYSEAAEERRNNQRECDGIFKFRGATELETGRFIHFNLEHDTSSM